MFTSISGDMQLTTLTHIRAVLSIIGMPRRKLQPSLQQHLDNTLISIINNFQRDESLLISHKPTQWRPTTNGRTKPTA